MKHLYAILLISVLFSAVGFPTVAQSSMSDKYGALQEKNREVEPRDGAIEISGKDGSIYVSTPYRVEVKVYTILGQMVMSRMVNPGVSELKMETRGVYLVKIEGRTQKVAL